MKDWWHWLTNKLDHDRFTAAALALILAVILPVGIYVGCTSKTVSPLTNEPVSRVVFEQHVLTVTEGILKKVAAANAMLDQAEIEAETIDDKSLIGRADLDAQDELKRQIAAILMAQGEQALLGGISIPGLVVGLGGIAGLLLGGAKTVDANRKDKLLAAVPARERKRAAAKVAKARRGET